MSTLKRLSLLGTGIFLVFTAAAGDEPGAVLGVALISYALMSK
jgi:hypothetical protein